MESTVPVAWQITLWGGLRATCGEKTVAHFRTLRCGLLLAILASRPERIHSREELGELLWPDEDPQWQRNRLRGELSELRHDLGEDIFEKSGNLGLRVRPGVSSDVARFDETVQAALRALAPERRVPLLQAAVALSEGDFLPGYYDDWSVRERERLLGLRREVEGHLTREAPLVAMPRASGEVVLLWHRKDSPEAEVAAELEGALRRRGLQVSQGQDTRLCKARIVIPIVSREALRSELFQYTLEVALDCQRSNVALQFLPVQLGPRAEKGDEAQAFWELLAPFPMVLWTTLHESLAALERLLTLSPEPLPVLESVGGGVDPQSPFYVERRADPELRRLLESHHSIILVRGGRQIGKTSLLARGMQLARERGWRSVRTDFQKLSSASLSGPNIFYRQLAVSLMRQCAFTYDFALLWEEALDPGQNFEYFLRDLLEAEPTPLIWSIDEADKLFSAPFSTDFFGLVRSWHNDRAAEPGGPLCRLSIVLAYATEAHLFIHDLNQSPFNVGERVPLDDFTREQVLYLNTLYGNPAETPAAVAEIHALLGGQPYLTRRALDLLAREPRGIEALVKNATREDGPFSDHLKRISASVGALPEVVTYVQTLLSGNTSPFFDPNVYFRLLRAGIVRQDSDGQVIFRCELYRRYLAEYLV